MIITTDTNLRDFNFWSGAKANANNFTTEELDQLESIIKDIYPDGCTDTQINDLFWFEPEILCEWLGIDFEEFENR